jgi:hypothetical protein
MFDGLMLLMLTAFLPLFLYWGISYFFVCRDVVRYVLDVVGWRG